MSSVRPATKTKTKRAECSAGTVALQEKHARRSPRAKRTANNVLAAHTQKGGEPPPPQQRAPTNSAREFSEKGAQWKIAFQCSAVRDCNRSREKQQTDGEQPPLHRQARNNFVRKFAEKGAQWKFVFQSSAVCDNFVNILFEATPFCCVGRKFNFALHRFLEQNFLTTAQVQCEEHRPLSCRLNTVIVKKKVQGEYQFTKLNETDEQGLTTAQLDFFSNYFQIRASDVMNPYISH